MNKLKNTNYCGLKINEQGGLLHLSVRQPEEELPVEASGPSQRRVDGVQPVCGSDHHDLTSAVQPVHQSEERRHDGAAG